MSAYFNEFNPYAAEWIRNLISGGHVAPGVVDARSIKEVQPSDVGDGQVHLFAGIAVWSHALREAGFTDDLPVWSCSCPCQPFSSAGRGKGTSDARHLWPDAFRLIKAKRPVAIFGEQVSAAEAVGKFRAGTRKRAPSATGAAWIDLVQTDLESAGYAVGFVVFPAASVGAPHQRHRLYWAAVRSDAGDWLAHHQQRLSQQRSEGVSTDRDASRGHDIDRRCEAGGLADNDGVRRTRISGRREDGIAERGEARGLADDGSEGRGEVRSLAERSGGGGGAQGLDQRSLHGGALDHRGLAHADEWEPAGDLRGGSGEGDDSTGRVSPASRGDGRALEWMGDADGEHPRGDAGAGDRTEGGTRLRAGGDESRAPGAAGRLGFAGFAGLEGHAGHENARRESGRLDSGEARPASAPGPTNGHWADVEWLPCRDDKFRPTQPGLFPLVDGAPERVGADGSLETQPRSSRLEAFGNAIVAAQAKEFLLAVKTVLRATPARRAA